MELNKVYHGDCLEIMKDIPDSSIDMVLCDLPYGVTNAKWDIEVDLDKLWSEYKRVIKDNSAIVLTAVQPFTSMLIMNDLKYFKYVWVWDKVNKFSGHLNAKKQPLRRTEDVLIFYKNQPTYNPQMLDGKPYCAISHGNKTSLYNSQIDNVKTICNGKRYPFNILSIKGDERGTVGRIHPTQKPVALFEYLIKTYSNEGDLVLDNCCGSGTTGVACIRTNRRFILIEKEEKYVNISNNRITEEIANCKG